MLEHDIITKEELKLVIAGMMLALTAAQRVYSLPENATAVSLNILVRELHKCSMPELVKHIKGFSEFADTILEITKENKA